MSAKSNQHLPESLNEQTDKSNVDPGKAAFNGGLEVPGEAPLAPKPAKGSLNDPTPGDDLEGGGWKIRDGSLRRPAFGVAFVGALYDLQGYF